VSPVTVALVLVTQPVVGTVVLVDLLYWRVPPEPLEVSATSHEVLEFAVVAKVCVLLTTGAVELVVDVSFTTKVSEALIVPPWLPVRILAVTCKDPSVVESAVGVTLKLAAPLLLVVTVPVVLPVNWLGDVTDQYNEVPVETLVVAILTVPEEPSSILVGAVRVYVGVEVIVPLRVLV
jgi:hypothetical protein